MGYSTPMRGHCHIESHDFGADTDTSYYFSGPAGYAGKLRSISVSTKEAFACTTTPARVYVGTAADPDAYGLLNIADETAINVVYNSEDDTDAIIDDDIPADTQVIIKLTQSVDNAADTGQGSVDVFIDWYK